MRRALVVVLLAVIASVALPAAPAAAETTVDPNGNVVRITIPVDIVGAEGKTSPDGTMSLVDYWEKILNDTWGAAFGQIPYKNCYRLELKLKLTAQGRNFDSTDGRHRIIVSAPTGGLTFDGTGFDGTKETSRNRTTGDSTGSLENDRDGAIPVDAAPTVVAHEFGHLMGLGDDRKDGAPKNGRDGTMMVGGVPGVDVNVVQRIDKVLIDRLGSIIERYLKDQGKKLPKCQAWNGPIRTTYMASIAGVTCTAEESGSVTLGVVDGEVSGIIEASGSETCTGPASTITEPTAIVLRLIGTFEDREFQLDVSEVIGDHALTPSCITGIIEIPVERGTGSAELVGNFVPGYTTTCNLMVERQSDDEPVG
ncbi:MAG: hypothetical protein ACT4PI_05795 [Actinomycetota bacterium]